MRGFVVLSSMLVVLPRACLLRAFVVRVSRCVFVRAAFDICCPAPCAVALILMLLLCVFRVAVRCAFFVRLGAFCLCVLLPLRVSRRTAAVLTCLLLLIIVIAGAMLAALMCCSVLWQLLSPVCRVLDCGLLARALLLFLLRVCPGGRACGIILFNALLRPAQLLVPMQHFLSCFLARGPRMSVHRSLYRFQRDSGSCRAGGLPYSSMVASSSMGLSSCPVAIVVSCRGIAPGAYSAPGA